MATPPSASIRTPSASTRNAHSAKEIWLLVAGIQLANLSAKKLGRLYRQRMQIEENFRDVKSQHFGEGLECSRSRGVGRFTVLVLIASLAAFVLWLLGTVAERGGLERWLHPGNGKRRVYSRLFLARLLVVLEACHDVLIESWSTRSDHLTNGSWMNMMPSWPIDAEGEVCGDTSGANHVLVVLNM